MRYNIRKYQMLRYILSTVTIVLLSTLESYAESPFAVPTFNCLGIYWSPVSSSKEKTVSVEYKKTTSSEWKEGLSIKYSDVNTSQEAYYRGSIVNLTSGTAYDIRLTLRPDNITEVFSATTWNENFPVEENITLPTASNQPLVINTGGTKSAYNLYKPAGESAVIDVKKKYANCIQINASYVIIRDLTLTNASKDAILLGNGIHDVIIEGCDINNWGGIDTCGIGIDRNAAVSTGYYNVVERIIIQRNRIHHPQGDANSWGEFNNCTGTYHPGGPHAIVFWNSGGNHVIRYNTCYSDMDHMYNDIFSGGSNSSTTAGFPSSDTDIYGNYLSHCYDDAIEVEGADRNIRIWGNYFDNVFKAIGNRSVIVGPLYVWKNVVRTANLPGPPNNYPTSFLKGSSTEGAQYVIHNTTLQPNGVSEGISSYCHNIFSRNNNIQVSSPANYCFGDIYSGCNMDYDLFNGLIKSDVSSSESYGINSFPIYDSIIYPTPFMGIGRFQLSKDSPGFDQGEPVPNFSDGYLGSQPDIGAHESGSSDMEFGVKAYLGIYPELSYPANHIDQISDIKIGPNPFSTSTRISFKTLNNAKISISMCDISGKKIKSILDEFLVAGNHDCLFTNNSDRDGTHLNSGIYLLVIKIGSTISASSILIITE